MLEAMTFEFHRNRYRSPRRPSDAAVMVRMPRSLSHDLTALTLAYEEPKYSILLRIIEEYVDSLRDDIEKGRWRMDHYRSDGWDDDTAVDASSRLENENQETDRAPSSRR